MLFYFIVGGLSAADWSVQRLGDDGLMPVSDGPAVAAFAAAATTVGPDIPSSGGGYAERQTEQSVGESGPMPNRSLLQSGTIIVKITTSVGINNCEGD